MWPGWPVSVSRISALAEYALAEYRAAGRSSIEALGFWVGWLGESVLCEPMPTRGPLPRTGPGARGRGLRDVSVVVVQLFGARTRTPRAAGGLAADAEPLPDRAVAVDVLLGQV